MYEPESTSEEIQQTEAETQVIPPSYPLVIPLGRRSTTNPDKVRAAGLSVLHKFQSRVSVEVCEGGLKILFKKTTNSKMQEEETLSFCGSILQK